jgi:hypothetical protein
MSVHPLVQDVVRIFLEGIDAEAPGLVEGLYLTGSAVLGDFHPDRSDIDFVAVTATAPDVAQLAALERVHARLRHQRPRPTFDGIYVTWDDLAHDPCHLDRRPHSHEGRFHPSCGGVGNPVTWHTVARYSEACRGPAPSSVDIRADPESLAAWTMGNLDGYWRRYRERAGRLLSTRGLVSLSPWAAAWAVLGVSRLHYTLATGEITSKHGAGLYALEAFPSAWHRLVRECLRIREGEWGRPLYVLPTRRRREWRAFVDMVIADARRFAPRAACGSDRRT